MTPEQLDELEKLRLAATGGKWQHQRWPCQLWEGDGPEAEMCAAIGPIYAKAEQPNREQVYADAKFMEAMSEHALPLVKALREAWGERDKYKAALDAELPAAWREDIESLNSCLERIGKERDEARAEVERLREAVRQVHALAETEERDYRCVRVVEQLREINKITKGMVK